MKIFITGMSGQLGTEVWTEAERRGHTVIGCGRSKQYENRSNNYFVLDLTERQNIHDIIVKENPDVVIHCMAWTDVDAAEDIVNRNAVFYTNVVATQEVLLGAIKSNAKFIYISTDYVFDSKERNAVDWCHTSNSINYYGFTKYLGEEITKQYNKSYIVRTSWVYGTNGKNFVKTMCKLAEAGKSFTVVNDQYGRPTNAADLAKLLVDMAEQEKYGIYHATNEGDYTTWYEFAKEILGESAYLVQPCTTEEFLRLHKQSARRPKYSILSTNNLAANGLKQLPDWKISLHNFLAKY